MRGDHSAPRISYLQGEVEIMSPLQTHEAIKPLIGRLVETYCLERNIPFSTVTVQVPEPGYVRRCIGGLPRKVITRA